MLNFNNKHFKKLAIPALLISVLSFSACKKDETEEAEPLPEQEANIRPVTPQSSAYVTQLFSYTPGPGQYTNTSLGNNDAALSVLKSKTGTVSLGFYGGNIVLGFDHTVLNQADKEDLIIYNNAFSTFAEPGVVWVMQDKNNNGKPDDTWFELAGSVQGQTGYMTNYAVTFTKPGTEAGDVSWTDNKGNSGIVKVLTGKKNYYPEWIKTDTYTLTGTLLPSTNINTSGAFYTSTPFTHGYADNIQGSDKLDIANAVDEKGNKVNLKGIDFIKVQTGIPFNMGALGELSTEINGVADLSFTGI
jgi:hypothetical protein